MEPDEVAPVAATHSVSESSATTPVRSSVAAAGEPGSMATEPTEPVSVPASPSPEGKPSGGGPRTLRPAGSPPVGVTLRYPSGLAGPTEFDTRARGRELLSLPDIDPQHTMTTESSSLQQWRTQLRRRRRHSSRRCRRRTVACRPAAVAAAARDAVA